MAERMISHYRVIDKLGEGGIGVVYKAEDIKLARPVALKFLTPELLGKAEAVGDLKSEARAASSLNHPNICTIYDIDEVDGQWFIVMEYLEGQTLAQLLVQGKPEPADALDYATLTCEALVAAHGREIVHGDIKPGNIFLTKDKRVKLLDFGLSKLMVPALSADGSTEKIEFPSTISGTLRYMSPEQARGRKTDYRSDIFSFGVVCYELLAGQRPFEGDTATEIITAVITKEPVSLDLLRPEVPSGFRRVVYKCLRKEPELRYQDMDDVLVDLKLLKSAMESRETVAKKKHKSVAVLPFLNLSRSADDEYFCEGITEDISTDLSKIRGLRVASRWLARSHQAMGLDVCGVGRELGIDSILQGSVQRAGKRLRITAQLINVADGFHLWAEKFDREIEDILAVQDEIAVAIARALQLRLTGVHKESLQRRGTRNSKAYDEFIKGRFHYWYRNTAADLEAAERHYRRASEFDPSYAQAWIGLAAVSNRLWWRGSPQRGKLLQQSQSALHRAQEIDPGMSYAHDARAGYHAFAGDVMLGEEILRDGLDANPDDPVLHYMLGSFQLSRGQIEKSEKSLMTTLELDPFFHSAHIYLARLEERYRRDIEKALAHVNEVLEFVPDFCHALRVKAKCGLLRQDFEEALRLLDKAREIDQPWAYHLTMEAIALAGLNRPEEALAKIEESQAENPEPTWGIMDQAQAMNATIALSILHELDGAFEWLEKTARVFLNSYNPRLFDVLDSLAALESIRRHDRYDKIKGEYLAKASSYT
jgi:serine/threonine protein kinase